MVGDHGVEPCRCANLALSKGYKSSPHTSAIPQNLVPAVELESTTPAYETGDYPLRLHWQNLAGEAGFEPASSVLETDSLAAELTPLYVNQQKPPA